MDPVTALGLASNIVQFVDFSWKLLSGTIDLYGSETGASADHDVLELISSDLIKLNDALLDPSYTVHVSDPIRDLAGQCKAVAQELFRILEKIKVVGSPNKWKSFVQALRGVWKKEQIEALVKRLESLRAEMHFRLQWMLSQRNSELQRILADLVAQNKRHETNQTREFHAHLQEVRDILSSLQSEAKLQRDALEGISKVTKEDIKFDAIEKASETPNNLEILIDKLSSLAKEARPYSWNHVLIKSLHFKSIRERYANVALHHGETFKWVLDSSSPTKFETWLRSRGGVYWIKGKAGSGKSTLMKFLVNHPDSQKALISWAGTKELVTAEFFFWNAGSAIQKSQEGLFRSLLYEILRKCPDLIPVVCVSKLAKLQGLQGDIEAWTQQELWHAIEQLKDQDKVKARFCFFIDGLDEYDGDPDCMVNVLKSFQSWSDLKLCVSSRPWNEFEEAFGRPADPQLALEDLTREDIRAYVLHTLESNSRFKALKVRDPRSHDLVQEIVDKARGVFLWVVLVVKSLLSGLVNADRIDDLQRRLREFPETLETYFSHMLSSIENIYREQTAQAFTYALTADEPLSLITYSYLDEVNLENMAFGNVDPLSLEEVALRQDDMRRRLNARCKGLLEVVNGEENTYEPDYVSRVGRRKVDFLHRTARDFLLTKDMQNMLSEHSKPSFDVRSLLCQAFLVQLKALDYRALYGSMALQEELLDNLILQAGILEFESTRPQVRLLDETKRCVVEHAQYFSIKEGECGFLQYLVNENLGLYICETIRRRPQLAREKKSALLRSFLGLGSGANSTVTWYTKKLDSKVVKSLLVSGASAKMIWPDFLSALQRQPPRNTDNSESDPASATSQLLQVVEALLCHGADPKQRIITQSNTQIIARPTGKSDGPQERALTTETSLSAQHIITTSFGKDKTAHLFHKLPTRQRSILSKMKASFSSKKAIKQFEGTRHRHIKTVW